MKRLFVFIIALVMVFSMISCGRPSQRQVEKMIEEAVEEALEDQADEEAKDDDEDMNEDNHKEDKDEDDKAEGSVSVGGMTFDYMGEEIPEGFPTDAVPLYESRDAEIIGASKVTAGNDYVYSMGIGTDDEPKDVIREIREELEKMYKKDEFQEISMGDFSMFVISTKEWSITLNVVDGEEEDYKTLVTYTALSNK